MRYIGSKHKLLDEIEAVITENVDGDEQIFLDLFAGTNCVGRYFKDKYAVYSNDLLFFSFTNAKATLENNQALEFGGLKNIGIDSPLEYLMGHADKYIHEGNIGYYEKNYTPTGGAMYLSVENGKRIDYIRNQIDEWNKEGVLSEYEYYYLVSSLVESIPFVSNITGTYGAYLKHWDKRALEKLTLRPLKVVNNHQINRAFNMDSSQLVKKISVDIAYIDTPYNNRQYASNYHLLENVANNAQPELSGKSRIFDWSNYKSNFAQKKKALDAMRDLIESVDAKHVVISYNSEGIISEEELVEIARTNSIDGKCVIKRIPYQKYKSKVESKSYDLYEIIIYIRKKEATKQISGGGNMKKQCTVWTGKSNELIKSPLNYVGGKYKLLNQILPLFPENIETFVDLFSGGANVGINVDAKKYIFNDMNYKINEMFRYFASCDVEELIGKIKSRIDEYGLSKTNEAAYLKFRSDYNENPNPLDLYILSSFSYNYQFRFNNSMQFNNPFGKNRSSFSGRMENNLRMFVDKLRQIDAQFIDGFFEDFDIDKLSGDDFVYLDPPYLITTGSYNDGNRGFSNWGVKQELGMYRLMQKLTNNGVKYALSNVLTHKGKRNEHLMQFIAENKVYVNRLNYSYDNASYNTVAGGSEEVLITNYECGNFNEMLSDDNVVTSRPLNYLEQLSFI